MQNQPKIDARTHMLQSQILTGHVLSPRVLEALDSIAREDFVPEHLKRSAYVDSEIPLGSGRFMMEPLDFARLLKFAALSADETVLDIGCATGYSAAVLSKLAQKVVAVEEAESLFKTASVALKAFPNVTLKHGPLSEGEPSQAPYDAILIGGAIQFLPQALSDQLREGGRLLATEHDASARVGTAGLSKFVEYRKLRGELSRITLRDANLALLPGFALPKSFTL